MDCWSLGEEKDIRLDSSDELITYEACEELLVLRNNPTLLFTLMVQDNWAWFKSVPFSQILLKLKAVRSWTYEQQSWSWQFKRTWSS